MKDWTYASYKRRPFSQDISNKDRESDNAGNDKKRQPLSCFRQNKRSIKETPTVSALRTHEAIDRKLGSPKAVLQSDQWILSPRTDKTLRVKVQTCQSQEVFNSASNSRTRNWRIETTWAQIMDCRKSEDHPCKPRNQTLCIFFLENSKLLVWANLDGDH